VHYNVIAKNDIMYLAFAISIYLMTVTVQSIYKERNLTLSFSIYCRVLSVSIANLIIHRGQRIRVFVFDV